MSNYFRDATLVVAIINILSPAKLGVAVFHCLEQKYMEHHSLTGLLMKNQIMKKIK